MINRLLIQQEIEKRHLEVTEAEVHQEVESVAKKFKIPLDSWYKMLQAERGLSPRQYHEEIIWPMLALKKLAGADINVTERELQRAFERDYGPRVQARMAVLDGNIRQCEEIWRRFDANPDDFERLTREYSSDSNSRALGGAIPPIRKHSDNAKLVETAFRMNEGEVSPLIEIAPNKYCVIKCEGRTQQVVQNLDQVRKELMEQLVDEKTQDSVSDIFKKIRENSQVTNYLTGSSTTPSVSNPIRQTSGTQPGKRAASVVP